METIKTLLSGILNIEFIQAILSNPRTKDGVLKVKVRPIEKKGQLMFQLESFTRTQAFHENLSPADAEEKLADYMEEFRQMQISTVSVNYTVLVSKKGKVTIQKKVQKGCVRPAELSHNRNKKYILQEGIPVPFLQDLKVMTKDGKIVHSRFDKFRQINRFLEFIEDILPKLEKEREITILDLKEDVIRHCNELSRKYGYEKLEFLVGDIADYDGVEEVDMVVTLHACNTATDFALAKAVGWNAKVILSVPCCQHELNGQIQKDKAAGYEVLAPILDYGLLKERFAALLTDGLRAKYLEEAGYETQVLEFIDMEHTPKNILLRAVKNSQSKVGSKEQIAACKKFLGVEPMLGALLDKGPRS